MSYTDMSVDIIKCLFYSDLPQTMINKAIKDFRKRLDVCHIMRFGRWWTLTILRELGSRT